MASIVPSIDPTTPDVTTPSAASQEQQQSSAAPTQAAPSSAAPESSSAQQTQQSTTQAQPSSSAAPESSAAPSSQAPEPSSSEQVSSQAPESSSAAPTTSAAPSSEAPASSEVVSSTEAAPESSAAPSSSAAVIPSSSSSVASSTSEAVTRPTTLTDTFTSTDANGVLYTITQTVRHGGTASESSAAAGNTSFLDNTGAVAGTFVAVGLVVTASVIAFIFFMLKRRRRSRLDRDVAAAAAAAAAASHHKGYDDEDDSGPAMTQYGGYYQSNSHGIEVLDHPQQRMDYDYEDPSGGYDHYANGLAPGDRMSTATAAGMAGFGAHSAQQNYDHDDQLQQHQQQSHDQYLVDDSYNAVTTDSHLTAGPTARERQSNGYYFDPNQVHAFADDQAYGGYDEPVPPMPTHHRSGSEGSVTRNEQGADRGLKITNV